MIDFKKHLSRQIGFLERSCASYDAGYHDEAIRMATILRVLIHDTNASTSLLKHLGANNINLLSTTSEPHPQSDFFLGMGISRIVVDGKNSHSVYAPQLGDGPPTNFFTPVPKWWNQIVMVLDGKHRLSRKNIALAASNKDGGAHVDKKLTPEYEALAKDGATGFFVYSEGSYKIEIPNKNAHMVSLRQMAYEVLNSPDLQ